MTIDSSALVAILRDEPERTAFAEAIVQAPFPRMSAATYLEVGVVVEGRRKPALSRLVDSVIAEGDIAIEPVLLVTRSSLARPIGTMAAAVGTQPS